MDLIGPNLRCGNSEHECLLWVKRVGSTRPTSSRHVRCASDSDRIGARGSPSLGATTGPMQCSKQYLDFVSTLLLLQRTLGQAPLRLLSECTLSRDNLDEKD
jgi:hypothetical protein